MLLSRTRRRGPPRRGGPEIAPVCPEIQKGKRDGKIEKIFGKPRAAGVGCPVAVLGFSHPGRAAANHKPPRSTVSQSLRPLALAAAPPPFHGRITMGEDAPAVLPVPATRLASEWSAAFRLAHERWPGRVSSVSRARHEDAFVVELDDGQKHHIGGEELAALGGTHGDEEDDIGRR